MQPINANNALKAGHVLYVSGTGGGKTTAVKKLNTIKDTDQVIFWDPHEDYNEEFKGRVVRRYRSFSKFLKAVAAGRMQSRGFKIALTVPENRENFLRFCAIAKGMGNGKHPKRLHVVCEEVPQVTQSVAKEVGEYGWLLTVGRKFGIVVHSIGQRVVEMSKTTLSQSPYKWIGCQESVKDAKRLAEETDIDVREIQKLKPLEYYFKSPGMGNVKKSRLKI